MRLFLLVAIVAALAAAAPLSSGTDGEFSASDFEAGSRANTYRQHFEPRHLKTLVEEMAAQSSTPTKASSADVTEALSSIQMKASSTEGELSRLP